MIETLLHIDYAIFDFINQSLSNVFFDGLMPFVRNKKTWIPLYVFLTVFIILKYKGKEALGILLLGVLSVVFADMISSHFLKPYFHRIRPCDLVSFSQHINLVLKDCSGAFSFPSSHAANHFALASFLALAFKQRFIILSYMLIFWALSICFAQVYVGVHFPSDILGGALLGIAIGYLLYFVLSKATKNKKYGNRRTIAILI